MIMINLFYYLEYHEDPGIAEVAFIWKSLHVTEPAQDLETFIDTIPTALRAENLFKKIKGPHTKNTF